MPYTTSSAFFEVLSLWGITHCFVNLGSDHPSLVEAIAEAKVNGRKIPRIITAQHEFVALSAAQGFYQATGKIAAVILHVDVGMQNAGGAVHNLYRSRTPCIIFAGLSPLTQEDELVGSRNEFIHWVQDNHNQAGIVRDYSKFTYEIRTGRNIAQVMSRALQLATSEPMGPVYLLGAREVMEEVVPAVHINLSHWLPVPAPALPPTAAVTIATLLSEAQSPLLLTTTLGRDIDAIPEVVKLAEALSITVLEATPFIGNFPPAHDLYAGVHWSGQGQNKLLAEADVILVVDSDVPWIPHENKPNPNATIIHIDIDPLKTAMPLFYIPARYRYTASAKEALRQIRLALNLTPELNEKVASRLERAKAARSARLKHLEVDSLEPSAIPNHATVPALLAQLKAALPANSLMLCETITNYGVTATHLAPGPGQYLTSGASSLGWHGGAAVGVGLASAAGLTRAEAESGSKPFICAVTGDGSFMFSVPSTVHAMASRYGVHFLTVILCNGGWRGPKLSTLGVHPHGFASRETAEELGVSFGKPQTQFGELARASAGGGDNVLVARVYQNDLLGETFRKAVAAVQSGKSAVVEVVIPEL
ncbi:thiamine pyrophosphate enzyme [Calocera viscosa TUFC12733]|uniref:Thiamine pyrophosphate enzyme n=1 Tax=Calocera viscosa (strain TUFC12733) TaxID=1330018 RepID=A0A167GK81_CALVF|nr:thiamine pyrophosphate enzyme [Calocera viscosa TUFC12733]